MNQSTYTCAVAMRQVRANGRKTAIHGTRRIAAVVGPLITAFLLCAPAIGQSLQWLPGGPGPNTEGQVENITDREVDGAVEALAMDPSNSGVAYVGSVNGGIWKTTNAMDASPHWAQLVNDPKFLSIGALELDPTDASHKTLVAGAGKFSSYRVGGDLGGLLRTSDGGTHWTMIDGKGGLRNLNVTGLAPRGDTIIVATNSAGICRIINPAASCTWISGGPGTGLPAGPSFDLVADPIRPARLYTNGGKTGIYRSLNSGATWTKVSDPAMDALIGVATTNIKIAVGSSNNVYVAIANAEDPADLRYSELAGLFRSGDGADHWTALDLPQTLEGGGFSAGVNPGRQADLHLSIVADPHNTNLVYVGGDSQPNFTEFMAENPQNLPMWPNSIGAQDYSGRLFRVDASRPAGQQAVPLTHSDTTNGSAPHADSRRMRFAANGVLIDADDGGVYRRTSPQVGGGDWYSMNGDIQITEFHSAAWDANTHTIVGGAQDTGTPEQTSSSNVRWRSISTGDGGVVAVDDTSSPGLSTRYSSFYSLQAFRRQVYNSASQLQSEAYPKLQVVGGGAELEPQFYTPLQLNAVVPNRLIIGGSNSVYESVDEGDTITEIGPGIVVNESGPIAYGSANNPDILYIGSKSRVYVRKGPSPAPLEQSPSFIGNGNVMGIAIDPDNPDIAYAIDNNRVYQTKNAGMSWPDVSANLPNLAPGRLLSIAYITGSSYSGVVVGSSMGIFWAPPAFPSQWSPLGTGLPIALIFRLQYSAADKVLLAATLGRGTWKLKLSLNHR